MPILVWNWPVFPVMPCVITRVFLLIKIDMRAFPIYGPVNG
jgi:hypothetical protein